VPKDWVYDPVAQAQQIVEERRIEYNTVRSHKSIDTKTPLAFLPRVVNAEIYTFKLST
jgi:hypothetical protein